MSFYVVVVERLDRMLWRYGKADSNGQPGGDARLLRYGPDTRAGEPVGTPGPDHPTALLLVRRASPETHRIVYDICERRSRRMGADRTHLYHRVADGRATAGRAKGPGQTLLNWPQPPPAVADLEEAVRRRLIGRPESPPAIAARKIGWLFSNWKPASAIPTGPGWENPSGTPLWAATIEAWIRREAERTVGTWGPNWPGPSETCLMP